MQEGMNMRNKLEILLLALIIMTVSSGCIEPQIPPGSNETNITSPAPDQKSPTYNETEIARPSITEQESPAYIKTNVTFETWSRGYYSNMSHTQHYFRVITNYSEWNEFLEEQGYTGEIATKLDGTLFPGLFTKPKNITSADFNDYFIMAAMMRRKPVAEGPEVEIKSINIANNIINVTVRMYESTVGAGIFSAPYHIIMVKRDLFPMKNLIFVFMGTEGKELGKVEVREL